MTLRQFTVIPQAILDDARSWLGYFRERAPEKEWMWPDHWGWTGPEMQEHWDRYFENPSDMEARKNLITEWVRLSPERGGKIASLAIVALFIAATLGWLAFAVAVVWV